MATRFFFLVVFNLLLWSPASFCQPVSVAKKRPNIIFILSDDHAYQAISAYGFGLNKTPNIDLIAKEGILFKRAFVTNSLCAPSRAAILTGKYGHLNGITGNGTEKFNGNQNTFPKLLKQSGYQTAVIGKWHLNSDPVGFDFWKILPGQGHYYQPDFIENGTRKTDTGYATNLTTDFALTWLNQRDTSKPFCILVWEKAPHRDWLPPVKYLHLFDSINIPLPATFYDDYSTRTRAAHEQKMQVNRDLADNYDLKLHFEIPNPPGRLDETWKGFLSRFTPEERNIFEESYKKKNSAFFDAHLSGRELAAWKYQRYMQDYLSCIQSVDDNVGRLTQYLKENHLDNNTIVIYSSDQGFYLGEHGWFDKRFMYDQSFRTPLLIKWPAVIRPGTTDSHLVMNIDIAETLLEAAGVNIPEEMQGQSMLPLLKNQQPANWRKAVYYHYYEAGDEHNVAKHIGIRSDHYKLIYFYENKEWEFYNLQKDPEEINNVYANPVYKKQISEMKKRLAGMQKKYKDPEPAIYSR
ncbi:MAG: sulfatase [Chitinophagaceae bacterium]